MFYTLDFSVLLDSMHLIIKGLWITIFVSAVSSVIAFLIGLFIAFCRNIPNRFINFIASAWVELIRNTPLLIQLYILYKGLPSIGINFSSITCGIIALSFYTASYISEVIRSGINSIAKEQIEASRGLGFNYVQTFKLIILPQALRIVIAPLGSQFINLIKNSSLVSFIAVTDMFYVVYKGAVDDFRIIEFFTFGIVAYMSLTSFIALAVHLLDKKYKIPGKALGV